VPVPRAVADQVATSKLTRFLIRSLWLAVLTRRVTALGSDTSFARITATQTEVISAVALIIYTKPGCPYCQQARDYYNSKGITFIDRDAQNSKEFRAEMFKYSNGDPTVPCIVKDGKYVQSGWGDPLRG
jgi:glutaredoxin 3